MLEEVCPPCVLVLATVVTSLVVLVLGSRGRIKIHRTQTEPKNIPLKEGLKIGVFWCLEVRVE